MFLTNSHGSFRKGDSNQRHVHGHSHGPLSRIYHHGIRHTLTGVATKYNTGFVNKVTGHVNRNALAVPFLGLLLQVGSYNIDQLAKQGTM